MSRFGTYSIITAIVLMLLPDILLVFEVEDVMTDPVYPILTMAVGGFGILLHVVSLVKEGGFSFSAFILLTSIALIISGVSLSALNVTGTHYLTLAGLLMIALWIAIPQKKNNKKADQN